jgi:quinohemoprotein ethanol dehydrogenase
MHAYVPPALNPPADAQPVELVAAGQKAYSQFCAGCHGDNGQTRGATFPDLTRSAMLHSQAGFDQIVLGGMLAEKGMGSFSAELKRADTAAIRAFIVNRAQELQRRPPFVPPVAPPAPAATQPHQETR